MRFFLSFLLGLPVFIDLDCLSIYPFCGGLPELFSLKVQIAVPLIFFWIFWCIYKGAARNIQNTYFLFGLALLFLSVVMLRIGGDSLYVLLVLFQLLPIFILLLEFSKVNNLLYSFKKIPNVFLIASIIAAFSSISGFVIFKGEQSRVSEFIYGYLNYWNDYTILLFSISVVMRQVLGFYSERKELTILWVFAFALVVLSTVLSGSRASLIFVVVLFFGIPISNFKKIFFAFLGFCLLVPVAIQNERLYVKINRILEGDVYSGRDLIWGQALDAFFENPFFGIERLPELSSLHSTFAEMVFFLGLFWFPLVISVIMLALFYVYMKAQIFNVSFLNFLYVGFLLGPFAFNAPLRQFHIFSLMTLLSVFIKLIKVSKVSHCVRK